jgi:uncharacterized protein YwgA
MDKLQRLSRLNELVEAAGGRIDGRKKLHKLTYLCQRAGTDIGQSYVFHMYGVYSPSLARDLEAAKEWNLIVEKEVDGPGGRYEISMGTAAQDEYGVTEDYSRDGLALVHDLANETPAILEVLTTIAYLWDAGYREPGLEEKLRQLKGHLAPNFPRAYKLARQHYLIQEVGAAG